MWPQLAPLLHADPGITITTPADLPAALAALPLPIIARPLDPPTEYCAFLAEYPADLELAYLRARTQSPSGHVHLQTAPPGRTLLLSALRQDTTWHIHPPVEITYFKKHALTPIQYTAPPDPNPDLTQLTTTLHKILATLPTTLPGIALELTQTPTGFQPTFARIINTLDDPIDTILSLTEDGQAACVQYLTPPTGILQHIQNLHTALTLPGVIDIEIHAQPGHTIRHLTTIPARNNIGHITTQAPTSTQARAHANRAAALLQVITTPFD